MQVIATRSFADAKVLGEVGVCVWFMLGFFLGILCGAKLNKVFTIANRKFSFVLLHSDTRTHRLEENLSSFPESAIFRIRKRTHINRKFT